MLPARLVGTVVTARGPQPFQLDTPTGRVVVGQWVAADPAQALLGPPERAAIDKQVRAQLGDDVKQVRVGEYCCASCRRWVDVVSRPDDWGQGRCARCT